MSAVKVINVFSRECPAFRKTLSFTHKRLSLFSLAFSNINFIAWLEHLQAYIAKTLFLNCLHSWFLSIHFTVTLEQHNTEFPPPQKYKKVDTESSLQSNK